MEWLQTYRIGDELIKTGKYQAVDAYLGSFYPSQLKDSQLRKTPYVLELIIDININVIRFEIRSFGAGTLEDGINSTVSKENFFTSVAGNFTSFYLCSSYGKEKSILDFFGVRKGEILKDTKKDEVGFDLEYSGLIKAGLLDESFRNSRLVKTRSLIRENNRLVHLLDKAISNLSLFVDDSKKTAFEKELNNGDELPKPLGSRLVLSKAGNSEIAIIVVKIVNGEEEFYLNREPEAIDFYYKRFLLLANINLNRGKNGVCYFSGPNQVFDISLPRDNINVLKINTNSPTTQSNLFGENFLLSKEAYEKLKLGGWFISKKFVVKIAGVKHYILPDFTADFKILDYKAELTDKVDMVFNLKDYKRMHQRLYHLSNNCLNSISFLGFFGDDRQIDIVNRIQLVNPDYFNSVFDVFEEERYKIYQLTENKAINLFTLAASYTLFPISSNNPKKNASLEFFKMLLEKIPISDSFLIDNFIKLVKLYKYGKSDEKTKKFTGILNIPYQNPKYFDFWASTAALKFLILLNLVNRIFKNQIPMEKENQTLSKTEQFFEVSDLSNSESKKSLFYLGKLIRRVALAQQSQGNSKAILNKINYSGMTIHDIQWLSCEVFEKLKQYNRGEFPALDLGENDWALFNNHFCIANSKGQDSWCLSEVENIFYLFIGYGMYWQTMNKKEKKIVKDLKNIDISDEIEPDSEIEPDQE